MQAAAALALAPEDRHWSESGEIVAVATQEDFSELISHTESTAETTGVLIERRVHVRCVLRPGPQAR